MPGEPVLSGAQVKTIRKQLGLTMAELGRLLGYEGKWPSHWVDQIERGKNGRHLDYVKANLLLAIAEGYEPVREVEAVSDPTAG